MSEPRITNGQSWNFGAPVTACAFDHTGIGAFACGDGTLRVFAEDVEPQTFELHQGAILSLIAHPKGGFLTGGDDGRLVHWQASEQPREIFAQKNRWIENIAASPRK